MAKKQRLTLPQRHSTLLEVKIIMRRAEEMALREPNNPDILAILKSASLVLSQVENELNKDFLVYAAQFGAKVTEEDYPHALKTWYEDDFLPFLKEYQNEQ